MVDIKIINKLVDDLNELSNKLSPQDQNILHTAIIAIRTLSMEYAEVQMDNLNMKHYLATKRDKGKGGL